MTPGEAIADWLEFTIGHDDYSTAELARRIDAAIAEAASLRKEDGEIIGAAKDAEIERLTCLYNAAFKDAARMSKAIDDNAESEEAALASRLEECLGTLREMEWAGPDRNYADCPCCGNYRDSRNGPAECEPPGHATDCRLAACLRDTPAAETQATKEMP